MQPISIYTGAADALDLVYQSARDRDAPWPRPFVILAIGYAGAFGGRSRYGDLAAKMIGTLPVNTRDALLEQYDLPSAVRLALEEGDALPWPAVVDIEDFGAVLGLDLAHVQAMARARVLDMVRQVRIAYLTTLPGQAATYRMKAEEAEAVLAPGADLSDLSAVPHIAREAETLGDTVLAVAERVAAKAAAYRAASAAVDAARVAALAAIEAAENPAEVEAAEAGIAAVIAAVMAAAGV